MVNNAAMNIHVRVLCGGTSSILLPPYLGAAFLAHVVTLGWTFLGTARLVTILPFYIPTSKA